MNLEELKKIIKENNGEKFIILDSDKPSFVLMSFSEYRKLLINSNPSNPNNPSLSDARHKETKKSKTDNDLTIDDLPLQ